MSMSEYNRDIDGQEQNDPTCPTGLHDFPADFSEEDMAFAQEIGSLFAIDEEVMPPLFVQTLMESEDARYQPIEPRFEQKTSARVFRRLKLRRRLFGTHRLAWQHLSDRLPGQRVLVAFVAACLLFMLVTMVATSASFASGLNILMTGKHGGVLQSLGYPTGLLARKNTNVTSKAVKPVANVPLRAKQLSLMEMQQQLQFPMYLPTSLPKNYTMSGISMHENLGYQWADGPIMEVDYRFTRSIASRGLGGVTIYEFKAKEQVLQVVQQGAAHLIQFDGQGHASAIYVDGQWVRISKYAHTWSYGTRSELIYEMNGVLFWIVGDQRDGISRDELLSIAGSLKVFDVNHALHMIGRITAMDVAVDDPSWVFANDVVYIDSPDGPLWTIIGSGDDASTSHFLSERGREH